MFLEKNSITQFQFDEVNIVEIWDGYLIDGTLANRDLVRGEPIPKGLYHLVSEILVRHVDGDYLLMRRDIRKPNYGGYYEATAGGSALKGEDKVFCAKRELFEETGISSDDLQEIGRYTSHNTIYYNFLCVTDWEKSSISLQEGETMSYKWISENDFIAFVNSNEMIDIQRTRYHNYFVKMGYIR
jgi:8-oxo-dGTP pyrophosphatase MutT (NUDIX family)